MKPLLFGAAILATAGSARAAEMPVAEVSQLQMHSSFWQNLHHFLEDETLSGTAIDAGLRTTLLSAAPLYQKYWWQEHDSENRAWIEAAARRTKPVASSIIANLTALYGVAWFTTPVRVDVVRYGKNLGAYTSNNPRPHIVVASADDSYNDWASTEMLFHESSHALFFDVMNAINGALRVAQKDRAGDLWHVVLFYIAGQVTRQRLAMDGIDYRPYLYATGLFTRAWPRFQTPVETHVQAFIDGRATLNQMTTALAAAVP